MSDRTFYTVRPDDLKKAVTAEHTSLKDAETAIGERAIPEDLLVVEVVRVISGSVVPEKVRWNFSATRTRAKAASPRPRKPKKGAAPADPGPDAA